MSANAAAALTTARRSLSGWDRFGIALAAFVVIGGVVYLILCPPTTTKTTTEESPAPSTVVTTPTTITPPAPLIVVVDDDNARTSAFGPVTTLTSPSSSTPPSPERATSRSEPSALAISKRTTERAAWRPDTLVAALVALAAVLLATALWGGRLKLGLGGASLEVLASATDLAVAGFQEQLDSLQAQIDRIDERGRGGAVTW
jgi:hypothetical protein